MKKLFKSILSVFLCVCLAISIIAIVRPVRANALRSSVFDPLSMRMGVMFHWSAIENGMYNPIAFSDGSAPLTLDQFANSVDVEKIADEISAMGAEYLIFSDFHGGMVTLFPSEAQNRWRGPGYASQRDVAGEMIAALKNKGIKVILFTHPLDGHDIVYSQQVRLGWLDSANNYKKWNDYINDVYAEIIQRYGDDIEGVGFDSEYGLSGDALWYGKLDMKRLRDTILSRAPHLWLAGLPGPSDMTEGGWKEVWRPSWLDPWGSRSDTDYNTENWPSYRRSPKVAAGYHWATLRSFGLGGDSFNSTQPLNTDRWQTNLGAWSIQQNEFLSGNEGNVVYKQNSFGNAFYEFDVKITDNKGSSLNWAGIQLRKTNFGHQFYDSGYTVYVRSNGQVNIYKAGVGDVASVNAGLDVSSFKRIRVETVDKRIFVYVNYQTSPIIEYEDAAGTYMSGYSGLVACGTVSQFDNFFVGDIWKDGFANSINSWTSYYGTWGNQSGKMSGNEGHAAITGKTWDNATYQYSFKIEDYKGNIQNWAGINIRKANLNHQFYDSGYLVFFRANGEVNLYKPGIGILKSVSTAYNFMNETRVKLVSDGNQFRIYVDNGTTPVIEHKDDTYTSGYCSLVACGTRTTFDNVEINKTPLGMPQLNARQMFRYTVLQAGAATEGPGVVWGLSTFTDGYWERGVKDVLVQYNQYMNPVRESLRNVYPSTSYVTDEGKFISNLNNGITATRSTDDLYEYIHVLNAPSGTKILTLPVPADGKIFTSARLLSNGNTVALTQNGSGVTLTLGASDNWNADDTVIKLSVEPSSIKKHGIAVHKRVSASSSEENVYSPWMTQGSFGRARVVDGNRAMFEPTTNWGIGGSGNYGFSSKDSLNSEHTEWLKIDLLSIYNIDTVDLYPGRNIYGFPKDFSIQVSTDNINWTTVASRADYPLPSAGIAQRFAFPGLNARYVKIVGTGLRQLPQDNNYYRMQFAEIEVFEAGKAPDIHSGLSGQGFTDSFSSGIGNWTANKGTWAVEQGEYSQSDFNGSTLNSTISGKTWGDAAGEFDFRILSYNGFNQNWAGCSIRKMNQGDTWGDSGYLVYFRANGEISILSASGGILQTVSTGLDFSIPTHVKIQAVGSNIKVYLNNETTPRINITDSVYKSGYFSLNTCGTHTHFDNVNIH